MIVLWLQACGFSEGFFEKEYFAAEKKNYELYLEAQEQIKENKYPEAIVTLEALWENTNSRAILENLAEAYRLNKQYTEGLVIVSDYLREHPGDFELRLMRTKLLLGMEKWEDAKEELQIILFNKKMSLWELVQDPDLQPYKKQAELQEILGVSTIQLRQQSQPDGGLIGEILLLEVQINHLATCELTIQEPPVTEQLQIQEIRIDSKKIDEWVVQTQLQINWLAIQEGEVAGIELPIFCDDDSIALQIESIAIEELVKREKKVRADKPLFLIPTMEDCIPTGIKSSNDVRELISVQFRANGLLEKECLVGFN